mgnify:CR=1 FL=1
MPAPSSPSQNVLVLQQVLRRGYQAHKMIFILPMPWPFSSSFSTAFRKASKKFRLPVQPRWSSHLPQPRKITTLHFCQQNSYLEKKTAPRNILSIHFRQHSESKPLCVGVTRCQMVSLQPKNLGQYCLVRVLLRRNLCPGDTLWRVHNISGIWFRRLIGQPWVCSSFPGQRCLKPFSRNYKPEFAVVKNFNAALGVNLSKRELSTSSIQIQFPDNKMKLREI